MATKLMRFNVVTDDDLEPRLVDVRLCDQLRGELEASKRGLDRGGKTLGMHLSALWCWAALARTGDTALKFDEWVNTVAALEPVEDEAPDADPTRPAASGASVSDSPSGSPAPPPPGGSTPPPPMTD